MLLYKPFPFLTPCPSQRKYLNYFAILVTLYLYHSLQWLWRYSEHMYMFWFFGIISNIVMSIFAHMIGYLLDYILKIKFLNVEFIKSKQNVCQRLGGLVTFPKFYSNSLLICYVKVVSHCFQLHLCFSGWAFFCIVLVIWILW